MLRRRPLVNMLDGAALATVISAFGLKDPVQIIVEELIEDVDAYYQRRDDLNRITVAHRLTPQSMSKAIYHELSHARQCEREFGGDGPAFHDAAHQAAILAAVSSTESFYEGEASALELLDYDLRLVQRGRMER